MRVAAFHKSLENRALVHTIAAPRAGQAEHFHLADKAGQNLALFQR